MAIRGFWLGTGLVAIAAEPNPPVVPAVEILGPGSQVSVDIVVTGNEITLILGKDAPQPGP